MIQRTISAAQKPYTPCVPKTEYSQPPAAPPMKTPTDCVVLYTPSANPLHSCGAVFDTREGRDASRTLKPEKNTHSKTEMRRTELSKISNPANAAKTRQMAPTNNSLVRPVFSACRRTGIRNARLTSTAGR